MGKQEQWKYVQSIHISQLILTLAGIDCARDDDLSCGCGKILPRVGKPTCV